MRYALRAIARRKLFAFLHVVSIGVSIGLCSVVYGLFDSMTHPILAMQAPRDLRWISYQGAWNRQLPAAVYNEHVGGMKTIVAAAGASAEYHQLASRNGNTRSPRVVTITSNYFQLLGVQAARGRLLGQADESAPGRHVVISDRLWRQLFPETNDIASATILLNQEPRQVIGVLRLEADFPGAYTDVWQLESRGAELRRSLVRVRPGASDGAVQAELATVASRLAAATGEPVGTWFRTRRAVGEPFRFQSFHFALIAAVIAVYLTACLNLTNLQLTRGMQRAREFATLMALGLSRRGLVVLMMLETVLLCAAGLALSAWLTILGVNVVRSRVPPSIGDYLIQPQVSWRVFLLSAGAAIAASLLVGLLPAMRLSRIDLHHAMKAGAELFRSHRAWTRALLVAQVALAFCVALAAGLLLRTVGRIQSLEGGDAERLIAASILVSPRGSSDRRGLDIVANEVLGVGRAEAGVRVAATARFARAENGVISVAVSGRAPREVQVGSWGYRVVTPGYLKTLGVAVVAGRDFESEPREAGVIVDRATASFLWPSEDPIGQMIKFGDASSAAPWVRVVGVVSHIRALANADVAEESDGRMGTVFMTRVGDTTRLAPHSFVQLLARASSDESAARLPNLLDRRLRELGTGVEILGVTPLLRASGIQAVRERQLFVTGVFVAFALVALAAVTLGVYATFSQAVALRQREYAVRMALGASASMVRRSVHREANVMILIGIAAGLAGAAFTVDTLAAFVRSARDRQDPWAFGAVVCVAFLVMSAASYIPARRAARVNAGQALNVE